MKKAKAKDYLRMFVQYAQENDIWFAVLGDGCIDAATDCEALEDFDSLPTVKIGTKEAFDWLVSEHKKIKRG